MNEKELVNARWEDYLKHYLSSGATLRFPKFVEPIVSVIIVTYKRTALELACLKSLLAWCDVPYEVIILNNGASQDNRDLMKSLFHVNVIKRPENIGFVCGVNEAATHAHGKYILLLNDDAQLTPDSLGYMIETIESGDNIAVVGGKIITYNNKIQDAGGILWASGFAAEYNKHQDPNIGSANFRRDVDYCSGAALLIRTDLFREFGCFDEDFSPGYGEESEFCTRAYTRGYRVVYDPRAVFFHYEAGSFEDNPDRDKLVRDHVRLLVTKHPHMKTTQFFPNDGELVARHHSRSKGRALLIMDSIEPNDDVILLVNSLLERDYFVTIFPISDDNQTWSDAYSWIPKEVEVMLYENYTQIARWYQQRNCFYGVVFTVGPMSSSLQGSLEFNAGTLVFNLDSPAVISQNLDLLISHLGPRVLWVDWQVPRPDTNAGDYAVFSYSSLISNLGMQVSMWPHDRLYPQRYIDEYRKAGVSVVATNDSFDLFMKKNGSFFHAVILARPLAIDYIDIVRKYSKAKIIYYIHDLHYLRETRMAELKGDLLGVARANDTKKVELEIMSKSNLVITVSEHERKIISEIAPDVTVDVWPWYCPTVKTEDRNNIIFLGGCNHSPNIDGLVWFVEEIFPLVKEEVPNAKFFILGSNPKPEILDMESEDISVIGYMKDPSPYFFDSKVFVCPIRYGAGLKGKIAMAMSYGVPIVSTSIGAEGMGLEDSGELLVADTEEQFAASVVKLLNDPIARESLSRNASRFIEDHWSESVVSKKLSQHLLEDINE